MISFSRNSIDFSFVGNPTSQELQLNNLVIQQSDTEKALVGQWVRYDVVRNATNLSVFLNGEIADEIELNEGQELDYGHIVLISPQGSNVLFDNVRVSPDWELYLEDPKDFHHDGIPSQLDAEITEKAPPK